MRTLVKVKVQPGQTVNFPGRCVRYQTPAVTTMMIRRRAGRRTREINVPISAEAEQILHHQTTMEARFMSTGRLIIALVAFVCLLLFILALPPAIHVLLRLALGLISAVFLAYSLYRGALRLSLRYADSAKHELLSAAQIHAFSWRATTFAFTNDDYAAQFRMLNAPFLMDVAPVVD